MNAKHLRTFILAAVAAGLVVSAAPAQVFSPTQPGGKSEPPPGGKTFSPSGPSGSPPAAPPAAAPEQPAGTPASGSASVEKVCEEIQAKIKNLTKVGSRDNKGSPAATCAAGGQGLGVIQAMRVIIEACSTGSDEMAKNLMGMFDGLIKGAIEMIAQECK